MVALQRVGQSQPSQFHVLESLCSGLSGTPAAACGEVYVNVCHIVCAGQH